ncbi:hypothetical protein J6590_043523 [Homalodisca vitripennis]|nr:hypothetical protein J6590_043523 [Homalodisca vitripennis]
MTSIGLERRIGPLDNLREHPRRISNIDVTLGTRDITRKIVNWEVVEESLSDHRLIKFEVKEREEVEGLQWEGKEAEICAQELQEVIKRVMERTVPKSRKGQKKVHWWIETISEMRLRMRRYSKQDLYRKIKEGNNIGHEEGGWMFHDDDRRDAESNTARSVAR